MLTKIHIKDLDNSFNTDLFPVHINSNDIITNDNPIEYKKGRKLRSQYSLEIHFDKLIRSKGNSSLEDCDLIYIPIYTFLLAWKIDYFYDVNKIVEKINEISHFIKEQEKPVLIIYSDVMWEDSRCFIDYFDFKNVFFVCYEDVINSNNQIPVPYITHITSDSEYTEKTNLICYAGRYRKELDYFDKLETVDLSKYQIEGQWISYNNSNMYDEIDRMYMKSYFSLQPHGDKQTRKGFYHSLLLGCIPVVFENNYKVYEKIFSRFVNIEDICIIIKDDEIHQIEDILMSKKMNIERMIEHIKKIKHLLYYEGDDILKYVIDEIRK